MSLNVRGYRKVARRPRLFPGVKKLTLPDQAMSLQEMFRRFVRREPLPMEKNGTYVESKYDLEKVMHMDIHEKKEVLEEMREDTKVKEGKVKAKQKELQDKAAAEAALQALKQKDPKDDSVAKP